MHQRGLLITQSNPVFWSSYSSNPVFPFSSAGSFSDDYDSGLGNLKIMWGRFCADSTVCEATEGSGSLSVSRGTEIIHRVIRCVSNQDFLLLPTDRKSMRQVFRTAIYADGTAVDIVTPRPIPVLDANAEVDISYDCYAVATTTVDAAYTEWDPVEVVLETGPFRSTFTREEISALDKFSCFHETDIGSPACIES